MNTEANVQVSVAEVERIAREIIVMAVTAKQELDHQGDLASHVGCAYDGWVAAHPDAGAAIDGVYCELVHIGFRW